MLEALKLIQETEVNLEKDKEEILERVQVYSDQKRHLLQKNNEDLQKELHRTIEELTKEEELKLSEERQELEAEAKEFSVRINKQYDAGSQVLIQKIIERMQEQYGCH